MDTPKDVAGLDAGAFGFGTNPPEVGFLWEVLKPADAAAPIVDLLRVLAGRGGASPDTDLLATGGRIGDDGIFRLLTPVFALLSEVRGGICGMEEAAEGTGMEDGFVGDARRGSLDSSGGLFSCSMVSR